MAAVSSMIGSLRAALESNVSDQAFAAVGLGVLLHLGIFRTSFPVENYLYTFLALYVTVILATVSVSLIITDLSQGQVLMRVACMISAFNSGLLVSISVYRLFFHRLRHFPGPFWSRLSRFYDAFLAGRNVQYHVEIEKLHDQYGDFIRTGPREICIVRKAAVPLVFGPQSKCLKSTYYDQVSVDDTVCSLHQSRDFDAHRKRRKAWDQGFSMKALGTYESPVKTKVDLFSAFVGSHPGQPVDATAWSMFLSFDIMGEVGFGKDFQNLTTGIEHPAIKAIHDHMSILGVLGHVPWFLNLMDRIPGAAAGYSGFFTWCAKEIERKRKVWDMTKSPEDIVSWLLKAYEEKDAAAPPSERALHQDSRLVIIAGSETTATTLTSALFYLAKYPIVQAKLQHQLDTAMPGGPQDWDYENIKSITFIDDIINETLRLRPAVMTGGSRVTPVEGLQVNEVHIPGDVNVIVPTHLLQTHERYYQEAKHFVPERWGEKRKEMGTDGAPFFPFLLGPYSCPGKNLALMSLRISLSTLAQQYEILFAPGETGESFEKDILDTFTTTQPPLNLQFRKR